MEKKQIINRKIKLFKPEIIKIVIKKTEDIFYAVSFFPNSCLYTPTTLICSFCGKKIKFACYYELPNKKMSWLTCSQLKKNKPPCFVKKEVLHEINKLNSFNYLLSCSIQQLEGIYPYDFYKEYDTSD
ncbi:MAG: hypothetical protein AABY22_36170 [Nanoarchaeota archaeon]